MTSFEKIRQGESHRPSIRPLEILSGLESFRGKFPFFVESRKVLSTGEWKAESGEFPPGLESLLSGNYPVNYLISRLSPVVYVLKKPKNVHLYYFE